MMYRNCDKTKRNFSPVMFTYFVVITRPHYGMGSLLHKSGSPNRNVIVMCILVRLSTLIIIRRGYKSKINCQPILDTDDFSHRWVADFS